MNPISHQSLPQTIVELREEQKGRGWKPTYWTGEWGIESSAFSARHA